MYKGQERERDLKFNSVNEIQWRAVSNKTIAADYKKKEGCIGEREAKARQLWKDKERERAKKPTPTASKTINIS